mmetsp:Transcript_2049/g.6206  ORF Transcript_2049/g.6206 Transcript_2049/m.6206 type:complete len:157 (-) Transcript_2049:253-723(-)
MMDYYFEFVAGERARASASQTEPPPHAEEVCTTDAPMRPYSCPVSVGFGLSKRRGGPRRPLPGPGPLSAFPEPRPLGGTCMPGMERCMPGMERWKWTSFHSSSFFQIRVSSVRRVAKPSWQSLTKLTIATSSDANRTLGEHSVTFVIPSSISSRFT